MSDTEAPLVPWRVRWYLRALLAAAALAFALFVLTGSGSDAVSGRVGGDFPAFYAAGHIARDDARTLYDQGAQAHAQTELFGTEPGGFLYFAYPPYLAVPYALLSTMPYRVSYVAHTLLMAAAVVLALHLLRPLLSFLDRYFEQCAIAAFAFYPLFVGVTGGQNTALVLLLVAAAFRLLDERHDLLAGLALAGVLFKPQFALPLIGVMLLVGRLRVLAGAALGGVGLYLVGAALQGWGWVGPWVEQVRWFTEVDARVNAGNAISWLGMTEAIWGVGSRTALVIGWGLAATTVAFIAWLWWSWRGTPLAPLMAVTVPSLILIAPHAMFYDAGVLVISLAFLADRWPRRAFGIAAVYAVALLQAGPTWFGAAPLAFVTAAVFVWTASVVVGERRISPRPVAVAP